MKNKKFNHGRTSSYFPIKQHRYDTTKHPVNKSDEKCRAKVPIALSYQEGQIIEGLSLVLQVDAREAVRIACYEAARSLHKGVEHWLGNGSSLSKKQGHTDRQKKFVVKLPMDEKVTITQAAKELGCTDKEFVRTALIWLAKVIREQDYNDITNSKRIKQDTLAKTWRKDNLNTKGRLQSLRQAHKQAYDEAERLGWERDREQRLAREAMVMEMGSAITAYQSVGAIDMENGDWEMVDTMIQIEEEERIEEETKGMNNQGLIAYWTEKYYVDLDISWELAKEMATDWVNEKERDKKEMEEMEEMSWDELQTWLHDDE